MKKILFVFLIGFSPITLATPDTSALSAYPSRKEALMAQTLVLEQDLKLLPVKHEKINSTLRYHVDITYPQITGKGLNGHAKQFNQRIRQIVTQDTAHFLNQVKQNRLAKHPNLKYHNQIIMDYDVDLIKTKQDLVISVRLITEKMLMGMAHPSHTYHVLNFDLTRGRALGLNDLFNSKKNYLKTFANYSMKKLNRNLNQTFLVAKGTAPKKDNYLIWNLEPDGVLITFNEYQVAPYVEGPQEVHIPYQVLKDLITSHALIAPCVSDEMNCLGKF